MLQEAGLYMAYLEIIAGLKENIYQNSMQINTEHKLVHTDNKEVWNFVNKFAQCGHIMKTSLPKDIFAVAPKSNKRNREINFSSTPTDALKKLKVC